tara:strand:+ start:541 stop:720 length:180 start_codon:yes stop_codon:yes gene_type:complete
MKTSHDKASEEMADLDTCVAMDTHNFFLFFIGWSLSILAIPETIERGTIRSQPYGSANI